MDVDEATAQKLLHFDVFELCDGESVEQSDDDSNEHDNFSSLRGIGPAIEDALHDAGFETFEDLRRVTNEELLDIDRIGAGSLDRLRESLDETTTDNTEIGDETDDSMFDIGSE